MPHSSWGSLGRLYRRSDFKLNPLSRCSEGKGPLHKGSYLYKPSGGGEHVRDLELQVFAHIRRAVCVYVWGVLVKEGLGGIWGGKLGRGANHDWSCKICSGP